MSIVWIVCSTYNNYVSINIKNGLQAFDDEPVYLTLMNLRWYDFILLSTRSILLIIITSSKNIYDSFYGEAIIYLPPDVRSIKELEGVLHNTTAIGDFYEYLETLYQANLK